MLNTIARLKEAETAKEREMVLSELQDRHPPPGFNGPALGYANGPVGPGESVRGCSSRSDVPTLPTFSVRF